MLAALGVHVRKPDVAQQGSRQLGGLGRVWFTFCTNHTAPRLVSTELKQSIQALGVAQAVASLAALSVCAVVCCLHVVRRCEQATSRP